MGKIMHKGHWKHANWTSCGRYVSSTKGSLRDMDIRISDKDEEVTCLACTNKMGRIYEEARAEKQSE